MVRGIFLNFFKNSLEYSNLNTIQYGEFYITAGKSAIGMESIVFEHSFTNTPTVIAVPGGVDNGTNTWMRSDFAICKRSNTDFTFVVHNNEQTAYTVKVYWLAIGK